MIQPEGRMGVTMSLGGADKRWRWQYCVVVWGVCEKLLVSAAVVVGDGIEVVANVVLTVAGLNALQFEIDMGA